MDPAVVPYLRRQHRPSSAPCARLQPRQFHANAGDAQGGGAVVTHKPAREAGQDRCQGRQPWPLRHLPNGRGCSVASDVPGNPVPDRPAAGTARASMRSAAGQMRQGKTAEVRLDRGKARVPAPRGRQSSAFALARASSWATFIALAAQKREHGPNRYRNLENVGSITARVRSGHAIPGTIIVQASDRHCFNAGHPWT